MTDSYTGRERISAIGAIVLVILCVAGLRATAASAQSGETVRGQVVEVRGDDVVVKVDPASAVRRGDRVELFFVTASGRMEVPVGTWKVTEVRDGAVSATPVEKLNPVRIGLKAAIHPAGERPAATLQQPFVGSVAPRYLDSISADRYLDDPDDAEAEPRTTGEALASMGLTYGSSPASEGDAQTLTVEQLKRFAEGSGRGPSGSREPIVVEAYVVQRFTYEDCPPCPEGAVCESCPPLHIVVNDRPRAAGGTQASDLTVRVIFADRFRVGGRYRLTVGLKDQGQGSADVSIRGYRSLN